MSRKLIEVLADVAAVATPEEAAIGYTSPALLARLSATEQDLARVREADPDDAGLGELVALRDQLAAAIESSTLRVRFRHPPQRVHQAIRQRAEEAGREARTAANRAVTERAARADLALDDLSDDELVGLMLELDGKGKAYTDDPELYTPKELLLEGVERAREALADRVLQMAGADLHADLEAVLDRIGTVAQVTSPDEFPRRFAVHLTEQEREEIGDADDGREAYEQAVARHLAFERERRGEVVAKERAKLLSRGREAVEQKLFDALVDTQAGGLTQNAYLREMIVAMTLWRTATGVWEAMFDSVADLDDQLSHEDERLRFEAESLFLFLRGLVLDRLPTNLTHLVASAPFRDALGRM